MAANYPAGADQPSTQQAPPTTLHAAAQVVLAQQLLRSRCSKCGYSLAGLSADALCPECGHSIALSLSSSDPPSALSLYHSCAKCSYNLLGLPSDANCPECGFPVADSLRGIALALADRAYLLHIRSGLSYALSGILACLIVTSAMLFVLASGPTLNSSLNTLIFAAFAIAIFAVLTITSLGHWRYTHPDPGCRNLLHSAQRPARAFIIAFIILVPMTLLVELTQRIWPVARGTTLFEFKVTLLLVTCVIITLSLIFMAQYTRWLAGRVPDYALFSHADTCRWMLPLIAAFGAPLFLLGPLIALLLYWRLLRRMSTRLDAVLAAPPHDLVSPPTP